MDPFQVRVARLCPGHLPKIAEHFAALSERDLWLRFAATTSETWLARYLQRLDFARDAFFGVPFGGRLAGYCHLGLSPACAEFGVSVLPDFRRQGLAEAMLAACMNLSRRRGCSEFFAQVLVENAPMRALGAKLGLVAKCVDLGEVHLALDLDRTVAPNSGVDQGGIKLAVTGGLGLSQRSLAEPASSANRDRVGLRSTRASG